MSKINQIDGLITAMTRLLLHFFLVSLGFMCGAGVSYGQSSTTKLTTQANAPLNATKTTKPMWGDLSLEQRVALAPLQNQWPSMSELQKRKWQELSKNYHKLSPDEQAKLHARMMDWAKLSPDERARARLNFSVSKSVSAQERQKHWDAYQALSSEEKKAWQLKGMANTPNSAALAAQPQGKVIPGKAEKTATQATSSGKQTQTAP